MVTRGRLQELLPNWALGLGLFVQFLVESVGGYHLIQFCFQFSCPEKLSVGNIKRELVSFKLRS